MREIKPKVHMEIINILKRLIPYHLLYEYSIIKYNFTNINIICWFPHNSAFQVHSFPVNF